MRQAAKIFSLILGVLIISGYAFAEYGLNFPAPATDIGQEIYDVHMFHPVRLVMGVPQFLYDTPYRTQRPQRVRHHNTDNSTSLHANAREPPFARAPVWFYRLFDPRSF